MTRRTYLVLPLLFTFVLAAAVQGARAQTIRVGPSAHCHAVDGVFTDCNPGATGAEEWSDIDYLPWAEANVITDQGGSPGDSPRSLFLMYDLVARNRPLAPTESFDIRFDVVEDGELEHYLVRVFGDGSFQAFEDGELIPNPDVSAAVGFGPSPTRPGSFDVFVELGVPMNVVYSPDIPLFWSTSAPPRCEPGSPKCEPCSPRDPACKTDGTRAAEVSPGQVAVSQTIVTANSDGSTVVTAVPLGTLPGDFCSQATGGGLLGDHVDAAVPKGGAYRNHGEYVALVERRTAQAVASLVNSGVLTRAEGERVKGCVVNRRARNGAGK